MSGDDWIAEYERAVADLPPPVPMAQWTEDEARAQAEAAFHEAPGSLDRERQYNRARREARALKSERGLHGISDRHPEAGAMIEEDLEWMRRYIAGFADWPIRLQIEHWYQFTTRDNSTEEERGRRNKGSPKTARGRKPDQSPVRAAVFVLMDWRKATGRPVTATLHRIVYDYGDDPHAPSEAVDWLAQELEELDDRMGEDNRGGTIAYEKLAFREIGAWQDAVSSGAHP